MADFIGGWGMHMKRRDDWTEKENITASESR